MAESLSVSEYSACQRDLAIRTGALKTNHKEFSQTIKRNAIALLPLWNKLQSPIIKTRPLANNTQNRPFYYYNFHPPRLQVTLPYVMKCISSFKVLGDSLKRAMLTSPLWQLNLHVIHVTKALMKFSRPVFVSSLPGFGMRLRMVDIHGENISEAPYPLLGWANSIRSSPSFAPSIAFAAASLRALVAKAADSMVTSKDVQLVRILGDGRCLFRAIARNLAAMEKRPLSQSSETKDADFLRSAAYQVICIERKKEFASSMIIEGDINAYCASMKSPSFYGGEAEMFVLSDLLQKPIAVFLEVTPGKYQRIVEYGEQYKKKDASGHVAVPIRVLYNGYNHYDGLLPRY